MRSPLALLSLLLAALAAQAQYGHVHQAQLQVRLAHSRQALPNEIIHKGRKGDTSETETVLLRENDCVVTVTWKNRLGVTLVGTNVSVKMDQTNVFPPKVTINPLSVVTIEREYPCLTTGVASITWELDYVIPHHTKKPKVADHPPVAVNRRVDLATPPYSTVIPTLPPVAAARHVGIIWV